MVYSLIAKFNELDEKLRDAIATDDQTASAVDSEIRACIEQLFSSKVEDLNEARAKIDFLLDLANREMESTAVLDELRRAIYAVFEMATYTEN